MLSQRKILNKSQKSLQFCSTFWVIYIYIYCYLYFRNLMIDGHASIYSRYRLTCIYIYLGIYSISVYGSRCPGLVKTLAYEPVIISNPCIFQEQTREVEIEQGERSGACNKRLTHIELRLRIEIVGTVTRLRV